MNKWDVVFDGTEKVGTVTLSDGNMDATAYFKTDEDARWFFNLLVELKNAKLDAEVRLTRVLHYVHEAEREGAK